MVLEMGKPMDNRPIGIFDSGLGGLTAVKQLERILPNEDIVYFGDTGRVPYGSKSKETLLKYAAQDVAFLKNYNVKAVLAACGTISTVANEVGTGCGVPYFDVLHATAAAAVAATKNGRIGVIGTSTTIASGAYSREILALDGSVQVFEQACPLFVPLVENGWISPQDEVTKLVAQRHLTPVAAMGVDTLILGCTHFPIIEAVIAKVMGEQVHLIDSGREAGDALMNCLKAAGGLSDAKGKGTQRFFVSDAPKAFSKIGALFLGHSLQTEAVQVNIETFSANQ